SLMAATSITNQVYKRMAEKGIPIFLLSDSINYRQILSHVFPPLPARTLERLSPHPASGR
ncbi:MAG: hypothetical protein ACREFL_05610, partial [Stellaceae bacterium]